MAVKKREENTAGKTVEHGCNTNTQTEDKSKEKEIPMVRSRTTKMWPCIVVLWYLHEEFTL